MKNAATDVKKEVNKAGEDVKAEASKASNGVKKATGEAADKVEKAAKDNQDQAEHLLDEARAAASKVGEIISKEAEELEDRAKEAGKSISKSFDTSVKKFQSLWKDFSSNPKYWLSTLSVVNVAVVGAAGYFGYQNRNEIKTWDRKLLAAIAVGVAAVLGGESYAASKGAKKQLK
ncbi:hypothetical protein ACI68E_003012 [Malassezia pachydermatis]